MNHRNPYQHAADHWVGEELRQFDENHREPRFVIASLTAILLCISTVIGSGILSVALLFGLVWLPACLPYFVMTIGFIRRARLPSPSRTSGWVWAISIVLHGIVFGLAMFLLFSHWVIDSSFLLVILVWSSLSVMASFLGRGLDRAILRDREGAPEP